MIEDRNETEIVATVSRFLMEYAIEYVRIKKKSAKLMQKINMVNKYKKALCCDMSH